LDVTVKVVAWTPLKETAVVPVKPCPKMPTELPTLPLVGSSLANSAALMFKL
jgi:hypothetical protein